MNGLSNHAGTSNNRLKIQGLDNKYILFLIDGVRISGEFAGNLDFNMINLTDVERIEIVEGGMSSLYGSSAIGGVVNIITKIKNYHDWFIKFRDPNKTGLVSILHPWESGYDNSPIWDQPMSNIKVDKDLNYKRRDLEVSNSDERPLKTDYDRYVTLRDQFRDVHYDPHKLYEISDFNVVDVGFNALFLRANKDLLSLAKNFDLNFDDLNNFVSKTENEILAFTRR